MTDGKNFFDQPVKSCIRHMKIFEELKQVKKMTMQLVVC